MLYILNIYMHSGDEYESSNSTLEPIFSKDLARLEKIKNDLELNFNKNKNKSDFLKITIKEVQTKTQITREDVDNLNKELKRFFSF